MTNLTNTTQFINFSKLQSFNQSFPNPVVTDWTTFKEGIFNVFKQYEIIQWFVLIILWYVLFKQLRDQTYLNLSDAQVATIVSFVMASVNSILLFFKIFTTIQPLEMFFLIWIISIIAIRWNKST